MGLEGGKCLMKSMFKKHDLFKIVGITILLVAILTWIIPAGQFTGSDMVVGEISRLGIANLFFTGIYSLSTILYQITFLLVLGGFYCLLSTVDAYKGLIETITKKLKGKEIPFILITSFVFAGLASISSEVYPLLVFVPFFITIILNLKMDKITALCTTFGSILVGLLGATYSPYVYSYIGNYFGLLKANSQAVNYNLEIITKVAIFVLSFVLFNFFNLLHSKDTLKKKNKSVAAEDKFAVVVENKKTKKADKGSKIWPLIVIFAFIFVFLILGYISWNGSFGIKIFDKFHEWLLGIKIGDHPIFSYILGSSDTGVVAAFGTWPLFNIQIILLIAAAIIAIAYKVSFDELIEKFIEGAKKMSRIVLLLVLIYIVFVITNLSPIVPTITDWIVGLTKNLNIYLASLASFIASVLNVDLNFVAYNVGGYFAANAGNFTSLYAIITSSMYGFASFFAPTSAILMIGLAYLDIPYKDWMKYIWRFLVGILVGLLIIFSIIRFL